MTTTATASFATNTIAGLPLPAARDLRGLLKQSGYVPPPRQRLLTPSPETDAGRASRLGAEVHSYTWWVIFMWTAACNGDESSAEALRGEFGDAAADLIQERDILGVGRRARDRWAARPADVADLCRRVWMACEVA